jgi:hypothetical protein
MKKSYGARFAMIDLGLFWTWPGVESPGRNRSRHTVLSETRDESF